MSTGTGIEYAEVKETADPGSGPATTLRVWFDSTLKAFLGRFGTGLPMIIAINPNWLTQATWYIGGAGASDTNTGLTSLTPIATFGELRRRYGSTTARIPQTTTVNVQGDVADALVLDLILPIGVQYKVIGAAKATLFSGTLTARTLFVGSTNTPSSVTDATVGDWSTAGPGGTSLINHTIRLTSGGLGTAWLAKRTAATVARTTTFTTISAIGTEVAAAPAGTETYVVESYYTIGGLSIRAIAEGFLSTNADVTKVWVQNLNIGDESGTSRRVLSARVYGANHNNSIPRCSLINCSANAESIESTGGLNFLRCLATSVSATGPRSAGAWIAQNTLFPKGVEIWDQSYVALQFGTMVQGGNINVVNSTLRTSGTASLGGLWVFDSPNAGITVLDGTVQNTDAVGSWIAGSGNATYGWTLAPNSTVQYLPDNGAPYLTGASGDIEVRGYASATLYTRVYASQIPFVDPNNSVSFNSTIPAIGPLSNVQSGKLTLNAGTKSITTGVTVTATSVIGAQYNTRAGALTGVRLEIPSASRVVGAPGTGAFTVSSTTVAGVVDANDTSTVDWWIFG